VKDSMNHKDKRDISTLLEIMALLRDPERGCPWDREQDFGTIAPYTIEEAYEVADAIDRDDLQALREELGDLLLQVVFHAQMARELSAFDFGDVVAAICEKMIRRHPHVFAGETVADAEAQRDAWEGLKERERGSDSSVLDGVGLALPALMRAEKLGKRAGRVGFDWEDLGGVVAKVREELEEVEAASATGDPARRREEVGDLLFTVVNLARHLKVDPEEALRVANGKFETRFRRVETAVRDSGRNWDSFTPAELDALWQAAKAAGR
jgi:ATP diphosphatase